MISGSCLCGGVNFKWKPPVGPLRLSLPTRCRKVTDPHTHLLGCAVSISAFFKARTDHDIRTSGMESTPAYDTSFCRRCGYKVKPIKNGGPWFEIRGRSRR